MSFGVGIGDIALVAKTGFKIWLSVSGAKKERDDLMANLMQWQSRLEIVGPMLSNAQLPPPVAKLARDQLSEALANLKVLEEMNQKLVKGRVFRRAAWEVCGREQFEKYQSDLEKCVETIDSLFLCSSTEMVVRTTQENLGITQENNVILRGLEMSIGSLNPTPVSTQVRFIDALNRERLIPFEWCLTMDKFRSLVQINFDGSAGSSFVKKGEYDLINEENGAPLGAEEWGNTIKPGLFLSMAIVIRKQQEKGQNDRACPACKRQYTGPIGRGKDLQRVNCQYCGRWFQISSEIKTGMFSSVESLNGIGSDSNSSEPSGDDELIHIQRFHVLVSEIENRPSSPTLDDYLSGSDFLRHYEMIYGILSGEESESERESGRIVELSDDE